MRNHSAMGTREQEIYRFDNWQDMRNVLTVRYALLPYLYSELMQAALTDGMMFRPLAFDYPDDPTACRTEDQVMLGRDVMIAPVYEQNATGRHVYLPEDMLLVRFRSAEDFEVVPAHAGHCLGQSAIERVRHVHPPRACGAPGQACRVRGSGGRQPHDAIGLVRQRCGRTHRLLR